MVTAGILRFTHEKQNLVNAHSFPTLHLPHSTKARGTNSLQLRSLAATPLISHRRML